MRALWVVVVFACGHKSDPPASGNAGSANGAPGSGSAAPTGGSAGSGSAGSAASEAGSGSTAAAKPAIEGSLEYNTEPDELGLSVTFSGRIPVLPAIDAGAGLIADFDSDATTPQAPSPVVLRISPLGSKGKVETLPLIDRDLATEEWRKTAQGNGTWKPSPAFTKKVSARAAAIVKRLQDGGFVSLRKLDVPDDAARPFKIGEVTLQATRNADETRLALTLSDAGGKHLHEDTIQSYETNVPSGGIDGGNCRYSPIFGDAYTDPAKHMVFVYVRFRNGEECGPQPPKVIAWELPLASPDETAIETLLHEQVGPAILDVEDKFTADAQLIAGTTIAQRDDSPWIIKSNGQLYSGHDDANVQVVLSRDGKSAWASMTTTIGLDAPNDPHGQDAPWRVSSVMAKTAAGWRIVASTWTLAISDAESQKDAKAGQRKAGTFDGDGGDKELRDAFAKLVSNGLDADAANRADLVVLGSAPGERVVGGARFAKIWAKAYKGKIKMVSSTAKLAPSGTTGWVAASLELPQKGYKLPLQAFCVFDKTAAGTWSLVHAHVSVF